MTKKNKTWPGEPEGLFDRPRTEGSRRETRAASERLSALEGPFVFPYPRATRIIEDI